VPILQVPSQGSILVMEKGEACDAFQREMTQIFHVREMMCDEIIVK
jgi:hypothetical protein